MKCKEEGCIVDASPEGNGWCWRHAIYWGEEKLSRWVPVPHNAVRNALVPLFLFISTIEELGIQAEADALAEARESLNRALKILTYAVEKADISK